MLRLDAGPELHNHLGGPHAAAIFGLGETAAFVVLLRVFGDLVERGRRPAGEVVADRLLRGRDRTAAGRGHPHGRRGRRGSALADAGRATFAVEVRFRREADDVETAVATYVMALRS